MKKRIGILLAACCVSLAACGKGGTVNEGDQVNGSNPVQESVQTPQVSSQEPEESIQEPQESVQAPEESSQEPEESSQAPEEDSQPDESQFPEGLPSVDVQSMTQEELQSLADGMSEEEFWMWLSTLDSEDLDYVMENYATVTEDLPVGEEPEQGEEDAQAPEEDSQSDEFQLPEGLPSVDVQSMTPEELQSLADSMSEEEFWMWFSTLDSEDMDYLMENYATVTGGLLEGEELEQWEEENGVTTSAHWDWDEENEQWVLVEDAPEDGGEGQEPSAE